MTPEILVAPSAALVDAFTVQFERAAAEARAGGRSFSVGLPGGSVAPTFFPRLARAAVDWTKVDVFWVDERALPPTDPESNYEAADRLWLVPAGVPPSRIHRMPADGPDLEAAAEAYSRELDRVLGSPPVLDWAVLGMGPDGHICSLFPGHPLLMERDRTVAPVFDSPKPPPRRLTLTLPVVTAARLVILIAMGAPKAEPIREVIKDPASRLPAALALRGASKSWVLLDDAAGRRL
jgi:6-phosphogluconolactonase